MKTLIIGTGGVGGSVGAFLAKAGNDVTFIARGAHLEAMRQHGLKVDSGILGSFVIENPKAMTAEEYTDHPDVIFLCVKGYSLEDTIALIERTATENTVVIPLLNVVSTGNVLRQALPHLQITDGCIYIFAEITAPGHITQHNKAFKVVFGAPDKNNPPILHQIGDMLVQSGIHVSVSDDIKRDCFQKFAVVSPLAATGSFYDANAEKIRTTPHIKADFLALTQELIDLSKAMNIEFSTDMIAFNENNINTALPHTTASMHRDVLKGGSSEVDGLVFEVVRLGKKYHVATPVYAKIAKHFGFEA